MNKRIIFSVIVLLLMVVIIVTKNGKSEKVLIASGHPAWSPIMYQSDTNIVGAGPEIVKKVFSDLGVKVESRYEGSWDVVQEKAKNGDIDVLVAAYKTPTRETYMDYSIAYTVDPIVLVVKKGKAFTYTKWDDLIGKKGVVTVGDSYGKDFDAFIKEKLTPVEASTTEQAFALLNEGKADYFVYAQYSAENYIKENKLADQFEIIPNIVSAEDFYLTISKKSQYIGLMPKVNELLKKYSEDGTISKIIEKYNKSNELPVSN